MFIAASCTGSRPTRQGATPEPSTRHGNLPRRRPRAGFRSARPAFSTLPPDLVGGVRDHRLHDMGWRTPPSAGAPACPGGGASRSPPSSPRSAPRTAGGYSSSGMLNRPDQFRIPRLDVERVVLGVVLGGFGAVVAEFVDVVVPHEVVEPAAPERFLLRAPLDLRVQVAAVFVANLKQPRHVVDARDLLLVAGRQLLHVQVPEQVLHAHLHAVATSPPSWRRYSAAGSR